MKSEPPSDRPTPENRERDIEQAKSLQEQASRSGLRFEVFLPPGLAEWILDSVARGVFSDPGEAVFVMLGQARELEPHADLRHELLRRSFQASFDDERPGISLDEFNERMRKQLEELPVEAAVWVRSKPKRNDRQVFTAEAPEELIEAISNAKMDPRHDHLNELLKDWKP